MFNSSLILFCLYHRIISIKAHAATYLFINLSHVILYAQITLGLCKYMHIVVLPSWYPSDQHDAAGSFFREQAIALSESDIDVAVLAVCLHGLRNWRAIFSQGVDESIDLGLPTYRLNVMRWLPRSAKFDEIVVRFGLKLLFKRYVKKHGLPDAIHAQCALFGGVVARELSAEFNIPYLVTEHCSIYARDLVTQKDKVLAKKVFEQANKLIAVSEPFANDLKAAFCETAHQVWNIIPNMVEQQFLDNFEEPKKNNKFSFIAIGSLNKNKAIDNLLLAFYEQFRTNKNVTLTIAGDGVERANLELLSRELKLESQVTFLGNINRARALEEISNASVLVSASKYETFGVVLIEALALGKPVIATQCGGPETIVTSKVGLLAKNDNVQSLATQLQQLHLTYDSYNPVEIHEYCKLRFGKKAYINSMTKQFQDVIT